MNTPLIGQPLDRVDGPVKVKGTAHYSAEFQLPHMVHAVVVTSRVARGSIRSIDVKGARKVPGVLAVYTYHNFPRLTSPKSGGGGKAGEKAMPMQTPEISYDGQIIAMVVAEQLETAQQAAHLVQVSYDSLKPVVKLEDALDKAYEPDSFFGKKLKSQRGDVDAGLAGAAIRMDATYNTPIVHHNPMEPPATIASWEGGKLTLYTSTQGVVGSRDLVAAIFQLDKDHVRVLSPFLGGGFGCKGFVWAHPVLAAVAARELRRPVKLVQTRQQMFSLNGHRAHTRQEFSLGADASGKLQAVRHLVTAHTSTVDEFVESAGLLTSMLYDSPNLQVTHKLVPINIGTPTPMRAPGESVGSFALECAMDELAYKVGIDPLELRLRNYAETDPETGHPWSSKNLRECYTRAAERFGWSRRPATPGTLKEGHLLIGYGMATATYPGNRSTASARAVLHPDGSVTVSSATHDLGTGTYTIMSQIAGDALGLPMNKVHFHLGDSSLPPAPVAGGSQSAASVGPAVRQACLGLLCKVHELASQAGGPLAGKSMAEVEPHQGRLVLKSDSSQGVSYVQLLKSHRLDKLQAEATAATAADEKKGKPSTGGCPAMKEGVDPANDDKDQYSFHSFGAMFCEVAVDADLGTVRVRRFVSALDIGRILNHKTARSQAIGGIIYGIGMGLMEHTVMDEQRGRFATRNLADYLVPVNADIPDLEVIFIDKPDPHLNELGSRGVGEIGITGVAAALANAVYHATGKRVRDLPITPEKLMV